jgi:hypothetical protein
MTDLKHTDSDRINVFPELGETPCYRVYDSPIYSGKERLEAGVEFNAVYLLSGWLYTVRVV